MFAKAAELGSLSRVAADVGSTTSLISRNISAFEEELGGRLFYRTGRGLTLTELGEAILPKAQYLVSNAKNLINEAAAVMSSPRGVVNIGFVPSVSLSLAGPLHKIVQKNYPHIFLRIFEGYTGELASLLAHGKIDMVVSNHYRESVPRHDTHFKSNLYLAMGSSDLLAKREKIKFSEVAGLPLILPTYPNAMRKALDEIAAELNISLNVCMESSSAAVIKSAIIHSNIYSIIPLHLFEIERDFGVISAVPIFDPGIPQIVYIAVSDSHPMSIASRIVFKSLSELINMSLGKLANFPPA